MEGVKHAEESLTQQLADKTAGIGQQVSCLKQLLPAQTAVKTAIHALVYSATVDDAMFNNTND
jgi:hypothetical protein